MFVFKNVCLIVFLIVFKLFFCWFLRAILLAAGVMNMTFVIALTIFVLLEKLILTPSSFENTFKRLITIVPGILFIGFGIYLMTI